MSSSISYPDSEFLLAFPSPKLMKKHKPFALLLVLAVLHACGEPEETCTCACTCGSGEKTTIEAGSEAACASACEAHCGADSFTSSYDCRTEGATAETATER
jgi:hypothetical protein